MTDLKWTDRLPAEPGFYFVAVPDIKIFGGKPSYTIRVAGVVAPSEWVSAPVGTLFAGPLVPPVLND